MTIPPDIAAEAKRSHALLLEMHRVALQAEVPHSTLMSALNLFAGQVLAAMVRSYNIPESEVPNMARMFGEHMHEVARDTLDMPDRVKIKLEPQ